MVRLALERGLSDLAGKVEDAMKHGYIIWSNTMVKMYLDIVKHANIIWSNTMLFFISLFVIVYLGYSVFVIVYLVYSLFVIVYLVWLFNFKILILLSL